MYAVNQEYLDYINDPNNIGRTVQNKVVINGVSYFGDSLKTNPKIKHEATTFIGGFPSKTCEFEILNLDGTLTLNNTEVTVYKGEVINGNTTWIPMGIFKALNPNITNNESSKSIKFNGNDRAMLFDVPYTSELDWATGHTGLEIVQEICTNVAVTLETTDFAFADYTFTSKPNFPENITCREVIARIAEIGGEIAYISRAGELRITGQYIPPSYIPVEYQQVEYIESTGTQHINTGYVPQGHPEMQAEIQFTHTGYTANSNRIFGATGITTGGRFSTNFGGGSGDYTQFLAWINRNSEIRIANKNLDFWRQKHKYILSNSGIKIDDTPYGGYQSSIVCDCPFYFFTSPSSVDGNTNNHTKYRLYYGKLYENDILVRDLVPCYRKSDNEIGLYDRVNDVFYTNAGTGTFLHGDEIDVSPDVIPIGKEKRISLTKEPVYGAINTVALGKENIEDDIIYPATIETDRITWRIEDNPFVDLIREEIIEEVASHIIGMRITPFTIKGFVDDFIYDLNDVISIIDNDGNTFNGVLLKYETENRIRSNVGAETQTEKLVNHDIAGSTKNVIGQVKLQVNYNTQQITSLATKTEELEEEIKESATSILQDAENIIMEALTEYVTTGELETLQETISTQFQQTSEAFQFQFTNIYTQINNMDGAIQAEINERIKYIRFEDGNIIIGVAGNELILKQSNDRISFIQGENEVAYFSNNKLYVTDGEFLNSLKIGRFMFKPRENGNLSLVFVGGDS